MRDHVETNHGPAGKFSLQRRQSVLGKTLTAAAGTRSNSSPLLIHLFIGSMALPVIFFVGPLRLSPYRFVIILLFLPCVTAWASGKLGKVRPPDVLVLLYSLWAALALTIAHGPAVALEPAGILFLESFGTYLLARYLIRDARGFETMARSLCLVLAVLLPFALFETLTTRSILLEWFGKVFTVFGNVPKDPRWGLDRVQGPFEHPILFGVFCSAAFSLSLYALGYGRGALRRYFWPILSTIMVVLSLSSGPLSALLGQWLFIAWDRLTRRIPKRWTVLFIIIAVAYVVIDVLSNRTPVEVLISYTAFNVTSAYNRILIWQYGSAEVMRHPLFGIGISEWERAWFMSASMDMFWLAPAVQFGLPAIAFLVAAMAWIVLKLSRLKLADPKFHGYRTGLLITIAGLCLAGWSVHFWNATYCLFMFLLGSGVWMLDNVPVGDASPDKTKNAPSSERSLKTSRTSPPAPKKTMSYLRRSTGQ